MAYGTEKTFEIFWGEVVLELLVLLVLGSAGRCTCVRMYIRASQKESERERERERKRAREQESERERCEREREKDAQLREKDAQSFCVVFVTVLRIHMLLRCTSDLLVCY